MIENLIVKIVRLVHILHYYKDLWCSLQATKILSQALNALNNKDGNFHIPLFEWSFME